MRLDFDGLLATKCVSVKNQPCMVRQMLIDLNLDELYYYYYLFIISLDSGDWSCNTAEDPFGRTYVPNK